MTAALAAAVWLINLVVDSCGHFAFKRAAIDAGPGTSATTQWRAMLGQPWLWIGGLCFVVEFFAWVAFLSLVPLPQAVLLGTVSIVVVMLGGRLFFNERLSRMRIYGMVCIMAGVAMVGLG